MPHYSAIPALGPIITGQCSCHYNNHADTAVCCLEKRKVMDKLQKRYQEAGMKPTINCKDQDLCTTTITLTPGAPVNITPALAPPLDLSYNLAPPTSSPQSSPLITGPSNTLWLIPTEDSPPTHVWPVLLRIGLLTVFTHKKLIR